MLFRDAIAATEKLAARLAATEAANDDHPQGSADEPLAEIVKRLPKCKSEKTWARWMRERLQRGEVPVPEVAYKSGNAWMFHPGPAMEWFEGRYRGGD